MEATTTTATKCGPCAGTGRFITSVHNGKPTGPGGTCFRCGGKGVQTPKDVARNNYYDNHVRSVR